MSKQLALNLVIDADSGKFVKEVKKAESSVGRFEKLIDKTDDRTRIMAVGVKQLSTKTNQLSTGIIVAEDTVRSFKKRIEKTRSSTLTLAKYVKQLDVKSSKLGSTFDIAGKTVGRFEKHIKKANGSTRRLSEGVKQLNTKTNQLSAGAKKVGHASKKVGANAKMMTGSMKMLSGAFSAVNVGDFAAQIFNSIDAMQGMEAKLKTVTGSVGGAGQAMDQLTDFAKQTPYTLEQSVEAFARLNDQGLTPSMEAMRSYGNTAAAMGKDMATMVDAVASASKGEFELLKEFGIQAVSEGDKVAFTFREQTTEIQNNAGSIEAYLQSIGNNQFAGAMSDQMDRLSVKTANASIEFNLLTKELGDQGITAVFGLIIDNVGDAINSTTAWLTETGLITDVMSEGGAIIADVLQTLYILLKKAQLGYLMIGEVATGAMSSSAEATADLINLALKPLLKVIGTVADGWAMILKGMAKFTGSEVLGKAATTLENFSAATKDFKVSANDIKDLHQSMSNSIAATSQEIEKLKKSSAGDKVRNWFKSNVTAINQQKEAAIQALNETAKAGEKAPKPKKKGTPEKNKTTQKVIDENTAPFVYDEQSMQKLIADVEKLGTTWRDTGGTVSQAFSTVTQTINKLSDSTNHYTKLEEKLKTQRKEIMKINDLDERQEKIKQLDKLETQVADNRMLATVSSFAEISGAASKMFSEQSKGRKALHRLEQAFTLVEVGLTMEKSTVNLSSLAKISGAASQMFDEQSKGRETLHRLEQAFTIIEVGFAMKKAAANAMAAIANQGSGDPYTAFARIAAMAALMAGLGLFSGSVSGSPVSSEERQKKQGTGTVFGSDDKSESILHSSERIEELELDQYAELREMNASLHSLNRNITSLSRSLVSGYGKFDESSYQGELGTTGRIKLTELAIGKVIGSFKKTKKTLMDSGITILSQTLGEIIDSGMVNAQAYYDIKIKKSSGWGLKSKTKYTTEYQDIGDKIKHEFALVFTDIGNSINAAVEVLGVNLSGSLEDFVIDLPNISLKDMSGEEIEKELQTIFSKQADLMATHVLPGIIEYQKVGEGLYDTLIRVGQEQAIVNGQLDATGLALARFGDITNETKLAVSQSIITLMGGIEEFKEQTATYFSEFFTDAEQQAYLQKQISAQFAGLERAVPASREQFKALIQGLDLTSESGQQTFAALMQLVPAMDQFYDNTEAHAEQLAQMNGDLADELARLDMTDLQASIADIQQWRDAAIDAAKELGVADFAMIDKIADKKLADFIGGEIKQINDDFKQLTDTINATRQGIDASIFSLRKTLNGFDAVAHYSKQVSSLYGGLGNGSVSEQLAQVNQLNNAINQRYQAELDALAEARDAADERYQAEWDAYQTQLESVNALNEAAASLKEAAEAMLIGELSPLTLGEQLQQAETGFNQLLAQALSGDIDAINQLQGSAQQYLGLAQQYSPGDYKAIFDQVYGNLKQAGSQVAAEPVAPKPNQATLDYQQAAEKLAQDTISELQQLQTLTDKLDQQAAKDRNSALESVKKELKKAVEDSGLNIVTAINKLNEQMQQSTAHSKAGNNPQLDAMHNQLVLFNRNITDNRNEHLVRRRVV